MIGRIRKAVGFWLEPWTARDLADEWGEIAAEWRRIAESHRQVEQAALRVQEMGRALLEEAASVDDLRGRA